jgi:lipoteichoic acid synthase
VLERLTWPIALALVAAPALYLLVATRLRTSRRVLKIAGVCAAVWTASGCALHLGGWRERHLDALWISPHVELIRTTAISVAGGRRPPFPEDFPPEYMDDFRTFGARAPTAESTFRPPAAVARPRNVILIVLESVGAKYLQLYRHPQEWMPNLTTEARHALVFDNFYAHASFSYGSFRAINFSVYPGLPWHYALMPGERPPPATLASIMRERGARTGYFTSGDLDWEDTRWLLENSRSFDILQGAADLGCPLLSSWGAEDRCVFDRLLSWIDADRERPFFAICWTDQTHDPFVASADVAQVDAFAGNDQPPPFAADLSRYLNNIREVDAQLARVFAYLRERGIADDTLVAVTGDHGEAFADPHGQRGHSWTVYEEEVRVPLVLWNPKLFPGGARVPTIGGHVDLNPTLTDILGIEPHREWQGFSLFDPQRPPRAFFMAISGGEIFGVREGNWKFIYDVRNARESLFDLAADPQEQHDVASTEPALGLEFRRRIAAWIAFEEPFLVGREN